MEERRQRLGLEVLPIPEILRDAILSQYAFTQAAAFKELSEASRGVRSADRIEKLMAAHLKAEAAREGRKVPLQHTISRSLQQGSLGKLRKWGGESKKVSRRIAAFVAQLSGKVLRVAWSRIEAGEDVAAVLTDGSGLDMPGFRAHCASRLVWMATAGLHGASPESMVVGVGALDAARALTGGDEVDFELLLERVRTTVGTADAEASDEDRLLPTLCELGLCPLAAQTFEHLLCEAGKVFAAHGSQQKKRGAARPGYRELFEAALPLYLRHAAAH
jgi:hypothetical protein